MKATSQLLQGKVNQLKQQICDLEKEDRRATRQIFEMLSELKAEAHLCGKDTTEIDLKRKDFFNRCYLWELQH